MSDITHCASRQLRCRFNYSASASYTSTTLQLQVMEGKPRPAPLLKSALQQRNREKYDRKKRKEKKIRPITCYGLVSHFGQGINGFSNQSYPSV